MGKVTINDVAKEAGVSVSTVSKVMNNWTTISDETANRVRKAAQKLNYTPNYEKCDLSDRDAKGRSLFKPAYV